MDLLPKWLNDLKDSKKPLRINAYKKLNNLVSSKKAELSSTESFDIIRSCIAGFEDSSERCREEAALIVTQLIDTQDHSILDWVLPAIVTRIGLETAVEESEEIRLLLLRLAGKCMTCFPHDIGPRNFIDFFQILLINCYGDPYPDLKKEACRTTVQLCQIEPKQVSAITVPLAKALKTTCLLHKHAAVRCEGVRTFASLIKYGGEEILAPGKTEPEMSTTEHGLFILANDHSESVRLAVLQVLSTALLDVKNRLEQHRRYIPHVLLLSTDSFEAVQQEAKSLLDKIGKLYMLDNEDNRIDISKRHVSMKDVEWYADDDYPDMHFVLERVVKDGRYPILSARPPLGTRYAVAEAARNFLSKILSDIVAMDWVIPYSSNNRKAVALRILWVLLFHCEKNSIQFTEKVLGAVYKALRDKSEDVVNEASLCVAILGKFLTPEEYLPFFIGRPTDSKEKVEEEEDSIVQQTKTKTVVLSSVGAKEQTKTPTLFSTEASTLKCSILYSLAFLVEGSKQLLTPNNVAQLTQALTSSDIIESESEELLLSLLHTLTSVFEIFAERNFIATPEKPIPEEVKANVNQRTIDSIFLHALLIIKGSNFPLVRSKATECVELLSKLVTGSPDGIYSLHAARILHRYGATLPVQAFSDIVLLSSNKTELGDELKNIFIARLGEINYSLNVTDELRYFGVLEKLLWDHSFRTSTQSLTELLKVVILPLSAFNANHVASLFRIIGINCLCAVSSEAYREQLKGIMEEDPALPQKIVTLWCSASDSDDSEMRLVCCTAIPDMVCYPMNQGTANEFVQSVILRLDDSSDLIRLRLVSGLRQALAESGKVSPALLKEIESLMVPLTKKLLIYFDDQEETIGIRDAIEDCLHLLGKLSPHIVIDLARNAASKHVDPARCDRVISVVQSQV